MSISCDSVRSIHCSITRNETDGRYRIRDLSDGKPGVWIRLRSDRGIPVNHGSALEHEGKVYDAQLGPGGFVDRFVDYPQSLLLFRSGEPEKLPYVFSKSSMTSSPGEIWIRLSSDIPFVLHPNDHFRFGSSKDGSTAFEFHRFNVGTGSAQGIRPTMEDEEIAIDDLVIPDHPDIPVSWYGCYDGHGSYECSRFLSKNLHKIFQSNFPKQIVSVNEIASSLVRTFVAADDDFASFAKQRGISPNVGSVVVVVCIIANIIFCANLGDARAILGRADGSIVNLSQDMKPNNPSESERIKKCGGQVINNRVNGRLAVSRAIGDMEFKSTGVVSNVPEIRAVEMSNDEFILLACDGLFDVMSSEEVGKFVRCRISACVEKNEEPNPRQIAVDLVTESIMKRNTSDNVTVMIIFLKCFCTK